jgi:LysR family transcriptional regulator, glycine cleavage system transcriptional activator
LSLPTPSLDNLRCFIAAARLLRFTKAARSVALTPAAFGQRIKQLEDQLGVPLFTRTTRSVALTEAGLALLPHAEQCLAMAALGVRAARGEIGPPPTDIVLGTRHELGLSWIVPQLDALTKERPWLNLHLAFGSAPDLHRHVRTLEIDCAVTSARIADPKLEGIRLHREDYVLVGAATLLTELPLRRPEHAARHVLLDISADLPLFRYWRDAAGAVEGVRFGRHTYLGTVAAIRRRVLDGAGVAVLPLYVVQHDLAVHTLRRVFPKVVLGHDHFRLVFRADDPRRVLFESLAASLARTPLS